MDDWVVYTILGFMALVGFSWGIALWVHRGDFDQYNGD